MRVSMLAFALALVFVALAAAGCGGESAEGQKLAAIDAAREAYEEEAADGRDFSEGPCIADPLPEPRDDWVVVVVREPREEDENAAERCDAYREGRAEHAVELDEFGHIVRAQ